MKLYVLRPKIVDHYINLSYMFDGHIFNRYIDIKHCEIAHMILDENCERLLKYLAIADSVYSFRLTYFNELFLNFTISEQEKIFFEKALFYSLAEFRYINNIPINLKTKIIYQTKKNKKLTTKHCIEDCSGQKYKKALVLNGGGKDSAVLAESLKYINDIQPTLFTSSPVLAHYNIAKQSELNFIFSKRKPCHFIERNAKLSGHLPLNFYLLILATLIAYLKKYYYVITANEMSADDPNIIINGVNINHQYSKTSQFEKDLNMLLRQNNIPIKLFSGLRSFSDLQLCKVFASMDRYHKIFISCNNGLFNNTWCKKCEKCAFVLGAMFLFNQKSAEIIWGDTKSVFNNEMRKCLLNLINPSQKPFECVGTLSENCYLFKKLLLKKIITFSSKEHEVLSVNLRTLSNNNYDFKKITIPSEKQDDLYYEIIDSVNSIAKNFFVINKKT